MASVSCSSPLLFLLRGQFSSRITLSFSSPRSLNPSPAVVLRASATRGRNLHGEAGEDPAVLRRPVVSTAVTDEEAEEESSATEREMEDRGEEGELVDWEDQILEETVPLVGFVRMILHSGKYDIDDRLSPDHEKTIVEKLLLFHPERQQKIGPGIDFIKVGLHPEYEGSRCLFIVREDGQAVDFSFWKCVKGLIRKKYPLYADSFIIRHFRRRKPNE